MFRFLVAAQLVLLAPLLRSQSPTPQVKSIVNAASYAFGAVCPGELVAIFGTAMGPATLVHTTVTAGAVATTVSETRVLFDGVAAPLIYVSAAQIGAVVPFGVAVGGGTQVQVEYKGVKSAAVAMAVAASAPGVFTANSSGTGQAAALNQDNSVNGSTNFANKGDVITLFATGAGQTSPASVDGRIMGSDLARPRLPVTARFGNYDAEILYAGSAPGMVAGVLQINARVPLAAGPGRAPVVVTIGERDSARDVYVRVRYPEEGTPGMMRFLDSGKVRVGVDLSVGGAITYLSDSAHGINLVNNNDLGRQIQADYNGGPQPFGDDPNPDWPDWTWNPTQAGDSFGFASNVLESSNDGHTIYVKTVPMIWNVRNTPCECTIETWVELEGDAVHVRNRLNNNRSDRTQYFPHHQQTPAVYTIGNLYRIFTYDGAAPFTNAPVREILQAARPWAVWQPTERWAALVDETGWGVGVYSPETPELGGGYYKGTSGRTSDDACGALFYNTLDVLDYNIVYDYEFWIVAGDAPTIRSWVYRNRKPTQEPSWQFDRDRRHWWFKDLTDQGLPISGSLRLILDQNDPQLFGPFGLWQAADIPKLYIRAAYRTKSSTTAQVYFTNLGDQSFSEPKSIKFQIIPDGQIRTYEVNLAASPLYTGTINQFRFDPVYTGSPGETMDLYYISYKKLE